MDYTAEQVPEQKSRIETPQNVTSQPSRLDKLKGLLTRLKQKRDGNNPKVEIPQHQSENGEDYASEIEWPHGKIAFEMFRKGFPNYPEKQVQMKRIIDTFFNQEMANTEIFTDENGASFPFTKINVTELASELSGKQIPEALDGIVPKTKKVFIFPSFPMLANGHQFTFVELAYKEAMQALPRALDDINSGRLTQDVEIYTFGSPTNKKWGKVTEEYDQKLQKDAYGTLNNTYAAKMAEVLSSDPKLRAKTSIITIGHSMAASMAAGSAEKLIDMGLATQDGRERDEKGLPYIQVIMNAPVTLNKSEKRGREIKLGFAIDSVYSGVTSSHVRSATLAEMSGKFLGGVEKALKRRGIETHEEKGEVELKSKGHYAIMKAMSSSDLTIDASKVHVNIRRGTHDMTIPSGEFKAKAEAKMAGYDDSSPAPIGRNLIDENDLAIVNKNKSNARQFAVKGTHIFPIIFRQKEALLWDKSIRRISTPLADQM